MPNFDLFKHLIKALFIFKHTVHTNFLTNVMLRGKLFNPTLWMTTLVNTHQSNGPSFPSIFCES